MHSAHVKKHIKSRQLKVLHVEKETRSDMGDNVSSNSQVLDLAMRLTFLMEEKKNMVSYTKESQQ